MAELTHRNSTDKPASQAGKAHKCLRRTQANAVRSFLNGHASRKYRSDQPARTWYHSAITKGHLEMTDLSRSKNAVWPCEPFGLRRKTTRRSAGVCSPTRFHLLVLTLTTQLVGLVGVTQELSYHRVKPSREADAYQLLRDQRAIDPAMRAAMSAKTAAEGLPIPLPSNKP